MQRLFEWQWHSQSFADVPHYNKLLEFIDYRAQASESLPSIVRLFTPVPLLVA